MLTVSLDVQHVAVASPAGTARAHWTAARCIRLLRPLSSKLASVRKAQQYYSSRDNTKGGEGSTSRPSLRAFKTRAGKCQPDDGPRSYDLDYLDSPVPRKKLKRTYSSKSGSQRSNLGTITRQNSVRVTMKSRISLPLSISPGVLVLSGRGKCTDNQNPTNHTKFQEQKNTRRHGTQDMHQEAFRHLAKSTTPEGWKIIDGIYTAFEELLNMTASLRDGASAQSSKSLFSTCLRSLPKYIAGVESWYASEEIGCDIDVASSIYNELENFSLSQEPGWRPLKHVIRAHGVDMVTSAIVEGLIDLPMAHHLVLLCTRSSALGEARTLLNAMSESFSSSSVTGQQLQANARTVFQAARDYSIKSARLGFQFSLTRSLLRQGNPNKWMMNNETVTIWNSAIRSVIHQDNDSNDAALLLKAGILAGSGALKSTIDSEVQQLRLYFREKCPALGSIPVDEEPEFHAREDLNLSAGRSTTNIKAKRLGATSSMLLAILCAAQISQCCASESDEQSPQTQVVSLMRQMTTIAHQICELSLSYPKSESFQHRRQNQISGLLLAGAIGENFSLGLGLKAWDGDKARLHLDVLAALRPENDSQAQDSDLACEIARLCAESAQKQVFGYVQRLSQGLLQIREFPGTKSATRRYCKILAVNIAFEYAEGTSQQQHLDWALELEQKTYGNHSISTERTPGKTPSQGPRATRAGYKWEEGISEWIAKAPALGINGDPTKDPDLDLPKVDDRLSSQRHLQLSEVSPSVGNARATKRCLGKKRDRDDEIPSGRNQPSDSTLCPSPVSGSPECCRLMVDSTTLFNIDLDYEIDELSAPAASQVSTSRPDGGFDRRKLPKAKTAHRKQLFISHNKWGRSQIAGPRQEWDQENQGDEDELCC